MLVIVSLKNAMRTATPGKKKYLYFALECRNCIQLIEMLIYDFYTPFFYTPNTV